MKYIYLFLLIGFVTGSELFGGQDGRKNIGGEDEQKDAGRIVVGLLNGHRLQDALATGVAVV